MMNKYKNISIPTITEEIIDSCKNPSHICKICKKYENENAIFGTNEFWLCDECLEKLTKLLNNM